VFVLVVDAKKETTTNTKFGWDNVFLDYDTTPAKDGDIHNAKRLFQDWIGMNEGRDVACSSS